MGRAAGWMFAIDADAYWLASRIALTALPFAIVTSVGD
jgi:hypothetical protein